VHRHKCAQTPKECPFVTSSETPLPTMEPTLLIFSVGGGEFDVTPEPEHEVNLQRDSSAISSTPMKQPEKDQKERFVLETKKTVLAMRKQKVKAAKYWSLRDIIREMQADLLPRVEKELRKEFVGEDEG
jgi:hypothetical protein